MHKHTDERKLHGQTQPRTEETLWTIFENVHDVIVYVDLTGKILEVNRRVKRLLGYTREEVIGRHFAKLGVLRPANLPKVLTAFDHAVRERTVAAPNEHDANLMELELRRKDGSVARVEVSTRAVRKDGKLTGFLSTLRDLTARRRLEEQLRQSQKLEAVGQLAGGIAHDFNNLLTGILGYADALKQENPPGTAVYEAADAIERTAERAAELTGKLLGFARKGKYRIVPVNLHQTLSEVVEFLHRTLGKNIALRQQLDAESPMVLGDPGQLQHAFLNLAVNARDAMPDGGDLTFHTRTTTVAEVPCRGHPGAVPGEYVQVSVTDTGVGIPEDLLGRVFDPFFTTKKPGTASGMGLAMTYGIVENHGGFLRVSSELGEGTTFDVFLPLAREPAVRPARGTPRTEPARGTGRILVVDDEGVVRSVAQRLLRSLGYEAALASSGAEAVDYYLRHRNEVDLVLIDLAMSDMDGRECFLALKKIDPGVRAILCTGYGRDGKAQEALDEGMMGFIQKPYRARDLSRAIAAALGQ